MKLLFAIVQNDDAKKLITELNRNGFRVTRLNSSGGFLKTGNVTLMMGVPEEHLEKAIKLVKRNCRTRRQISGPVPPSDHAFPSFSAFNATMGDGEESTPRFFSDHMLEVTVGGATLFVMDVEKYA